MDYNRLGHSGLRVPALSFGTGTFGGGNDFFKAWGSTDAAGASRLVDVCLDHGLTMFDSAVPSFCTRTRAPLRAGAVAPGLVISVVDTGLTPVCLPISVTPAAAAPQQNP